MKPNWIIDLAKKADGIGMDRPSPKPGAPLREYLVTVSVQSALTENEVAGVFNYADYGPDIELLSTGIKEIPMENLFEKGKTPEVQERRTDEEIEKGPRTE